MESSASSGSSVDGESPFPPLQLSAADEQAVRDAVSSLLHFSLAQYESHVQEDHGAVSKLQWKPVLRREGITAYRKLHVSPRASDSNKVHSVLAVGTLRGSVDDLLFGPINVDAETAAAYGQVVVEDSLLGSAVLATIETPTREMPERSTTLFWRMHGSPSWVVNHVLSPRDMVVAEATGSTINSMGERVIYRVLHSVNMPGAPELGGSSRFPTPVLRAEACFAFLYRQLSLHDVHVYITGRVDPKGSLPPSITSRATAEGAVSLVMRTVEFAQTKKRTHLYRQQRGLHGDVPSSAKGLCQLCLESRKDAASASKYCQVCARRCCSACVHLRTVVRSADDVARRKEKKQKQKKALKKVVFCSACLSAAHSLSAWDLAVATADAVAARTGRNDAHASIPTHTR